MKYSDKFYPGRGFLIGNTKVVGISFQNDSFIIIKEPYLISSNVEIKTDMIDLSYPTGLDYYQIPSSSSISLTCEIIGIEGEFIDKIERGFIQRLLTEDITPIQLVRLVREKIKKR